MRRQTLFLGVLLLACAVPLAGADTLLIESVQQAAGLERPQRGDTMAQVEARFGSPEQTTPAVGHPPITRWTYPAFTVYFEGDHVIRAVARR